MKFTFHHSVLLNSIFKNGRQQFPQAILFSGVIIESLAVISNFEINKHRENIYKNTRWIREKLKLSEMRIELSFSEEISLTHC